MYFEGLNSEFCQFIENKVQYNLHTTVQEILELPELFQIRTRDDYYEVIPLFNYTTCTSNNPKDYLYQNILILQKNNNTKITFTSNNPIMTYTETTQTLTLNNITYTLYYTYNPVTGEPAPGEMTSIGVPTDKNGYYLDSEVTT